tara:strand:+ start:986 stop:1210 length:225 start_codon:yes stop_codon:yes gene_type:complete
MTNQEMVIERLQRLASVYEKSNVYFYQYATEQLIKLAKKDMENAVRHLDGAVEFGGDVNVKFFTDLRTYFLRLD